MSQSTWWDRVRTGGKKGFDVAWKTVDKLGQPVNKLSNKLGSEAFWPTTLDKESDKAARILKSFCKDGFYAEEDRPQEDGPKQKQKVVKKIPEKVIRNAKGLAIFTTMRSGLWISGAGGSGILVARLPDGSWSPPSGILLHTAGLGFLVGIDIYDCVVVINTDAALDAFTKIRCTLGSEISVAAGPVGAGGILDTELHKRQAAIFTYLKSRGFYAGVQIDGTVIIERSDENERFYGYKVSVKEIISGKIKRPPFEVRRLMETIKAAQGDSDFDESALPDEPPPGDYLLEEDGHVFGVPDKEDPDPYGVLALEKEGLGLREAGTNKRASWEEFSFNPSPSSPVHAVYARNSQDRAPSRGSWRASAFSNAEPKTPSSLRGSMDTPRTPILMTDTATQTDLPADPPSPSRWSARSGVSRRSSRGSFANGHHVQMQEVPEHDVLDTSPTRNEPENASKVHGYTTPPHTPPVNDETDQHPDPADDHEDAQIEEPVVHSIQSVQPTSPQMVSKPRLVTVQKRAPPKLPPRNPNRSGPLVIDASPIDPSGQHSFSNSPVDSKQDSSAKGYSETSSTETDQMSHTQSSARALPEEQFAEAGPSETKMDDVKLEDDDEDRPDPWAKVEQVRARESHDSSPMPGGFS